MGAKYTVAVTGASGYIATAVVGLLIGTGHDVLRISRGFSDDPEDERVKNISSRSNYEECYMVLWTRPSSLVASEVKELSRRTSEEAGRIALQIEEMQSDMDVAVDMVGKINEVILESTDITKRIATASTNS